MKLAICNVIGVPAQRRRENVPRLEALTTLLQAASSPTHDVDLVLLPGGYFRGKGDPAKEPILPAVWRVLAKYGVAACFGMDTAAKSLSDDDRVKAHSLPLYGFAWTPSDGACGPWRQRSITFQNASLVPTGLVAAPRWISVAGETVAPLVCGEFFNRGIRAAANAAGARVVVDMVHRGHGYRFTVGSRAWTSAGPPRAAAMACHTLGRNTTKRWAIDGQYDSSADSHILVTSPVRIEAHIIDVP